MSCAEEDIRARALHQIVDTSTSAKLAIRSKYQWLSKWDL